MTPGFWVFLVAGGVAGYMSGLAGDLSGAPTWLTLANAAVMGSALYAGSTTVEGDRE